MTEEQFNQAVPEGTALFMLQTASFSEAPCHASCQEQEAGHPFLAHLYAVQIPVAGLKRICILYTGKAGFALLLNSAALMRVLRKKGAPQAWNIFSQKAIG